MAEDTRIASVSTVPVPAPRPGKWLRPSVLALSVAIVFVAHFRPWEFAFLEEWPLAEFWVLSGPVDFFRHYAEWSLSRPLHLVPTGLGLLISGGALWGVWLVLALVAVAQFLTVVWALKPVSRSFWVNGAVALVIALHPLWPGGFLQRFLPAQAAALGLVVAAGLLIRWLQHGRIGALAGSGLALMAGLLVYPGPAVAAPLVAVAVALTLRATWRRRVIGVLTIVAATALVTLYSLVITRVIAPDAASYEAGNFGAGVTGTPRVILTLLIEALAGEGLILCAGIAAVVLLAVVLGLTRAVSPLSAGTIGVAAVVSPLCSVVYFGNIAWLYDIDRIGYATSLGLIAALLAWPLAARGRLPMQHAFAAVAVAASLVGAWYGIAQWQPYIALQHLLFEQIAPAMRELREKRLSSSSTTPAPTVLSTPSRSTTSTPVHTS